MHSRNKQVHYCEHWLLHLNNTCDEINVGQQTERKIFYNDCRTTEYSLMLLSYSNKINLFRRMCYDDFPSIYR